VVRAISLTHRSTLLATIVFLTFTPNSSLLRVAWLCS
jgi:hypothetical protein